MAYLSALPPAEAPRIVRRSTLRQFTPKTLTEPARILDHVQMARMMAAAAWPFADEVLHAP
ncbi:MAG TPA: hypothetical protein VIY54_02765 [Steroidobacteraceae bacterium]